MHTHANASRDDSRTRPAALKPAEPNQHIAPTSSPHGSTIYRKTSCPCGGGCPSCQASALKVSQPNDAAEIEADAIAERVMRMPADGTGVRANQRTDADSIHRKCDACEDEEEKIQRKQLPGNSGAVPQSPAHVKDVVRSAGQALDVSTRSFFEPRLGYDLGAVRLHTDPAANESARAVGARAYTLGRDIVFGSGEFDPHSDHGRYLLAHELAHVTQQDDNSNDEIRRITIGTGTPPPEWVASRSARPVPADELERVNEAIAHVQRIVDNPEMYSDCIAAFSEKCSGQSATAFADAANSAVLWRGDRKGAFASGGVNGNVMIYTRSGYDQGARGLAQTIVHELGHNCGVTGGDDHYFAEVSANYCVGPQNYLGVRIGSGFSLTNPLSIAFVYRRLFDLALGGRLQATVGGDLDLAGVFQAPFGASEANPFEASEFEIASTFAGLRGRIGPWGGEGFGGLTLGAEAGLDVGRFRIERETEPDEFEYGAGFIVQGTFGAEFYVPSNPGIWQFAPEVGFRFVRPLNPEAENIYELVLGWGGMY